MKRNTQLKEKFGKALAKALAQNQDLRVFIKAEALKQITRDYDVIYQVVKNQVITSSQERTSGSLTIREVLLPFFPNENELVEIENSLPLLTVFVPNLQDESFSAENWDTATEIPFVGIRSYESDDVKIIKSSGEEFVLEAKYIPDFPVVVVKDNERIVSNLNIEQYNSLNTNVLTDPSNTIQLKYTSENYYQIIDLNPPVPSGPRVPQIQADAYNVFGNYTPGGWQRDFIYYGLTPSHTQDGLNPSYREHITSFKLIGSPSSAYFWITSGQDPSLRSIVLGNNLTQASGWTDGSYEFKIINSFGAKNSNLGAEETKQFGAQPWDLFTITYQPVNNPWFFDLPVKTPVITSLRTIDFYNGAYFGTRIEFSVWDLNNFSNQWKLSFEEVDTSIEITTSVSQTNKYNANFSIEPSTGILKKIGLKFGSSLEESITNSYSSKYTDISDNLGNSVINFWDNVVNYYPTTNTLLPRTYSTGKVEFEFRPIQVQ